MWEARCLTTLWGPTACCRVTFNHFFNLIYDFSLAFSDLDGVGT
jgi:hypothetical protein